jgi:hypothetical protein
MVCVEGAMRDGVRLDDRLQAGDEARRYQRIKLCNLDPVIRDVQATHPTGNSRAERHGVARRREFHRVVSDDQERL